MESIKMRKILIAFAAVMVSFFSGAETLVTNVKGYHLVAGELQTFSALSFDNDQVTGLYQSRPNTDRYSNVIDAKGKTLLPGLIDAHGHVYGYGLTLSRVNLMGVASLKDAKAQIAKFYADHPEQKWILGRGWNQELWPSRTFPTANDLDNISKDKPIVLDRVDGHALWVNSKVLAMAGIDKSTESPAGGEIVKDENGNPTGILVDNAMDMVFKLIPKPDIEQVKDTLVLSLNKLASLGLTSVHDAGIDYLTYRAYRALHEEGRMPIRVYAMLDVTDPNYEKMLKASFYLPADGMLHIRSVKISADGALGSRGAALHEAYSDKPGHFGLLLHTRDKLNALTKQAMQAGFQVNTHAIGDKANTLALDSFANYIETTGTQKLRHRIEHAQVVRVGEFDRFVELEVVASMQPTHATSDKNMAEDRVGSKRIKGAYAWQTLLKKGVVIAGGSDFPVEPAEPFFGLHAAVTRQDRDNQPEGGWYANESVDMTQAFAMFTTDAAFSAHQEQLIGNLEVGKQADFILIDSDPFAIDPALLWQVSVDSTYVAGQLITGR